MVLISTSSSSSSSHSIPLSRNDFMHVHKLKDILSYEQWSCGIINVLHGAGLDASLPTIPEVATAANRNAVILVSYHHPYNDDDDDDEYINDVDNCCISTWILLTVSSFIRGQINDGHKHTISDVLTSLFHMYGTFTHQQIYSIMSSYYSEKYDPMMHHHRHHSIEQFVTYKCRQAYLLSNSNTIPNISEREIMACIVESIRVIYPTVYNTFVNSETATLQQFTTHVLNIQRTSSSNVSRRSGVAQVVQHSRSTSSRSRGRGPYNCSRCNKQGVWHVEHQCWIDVMCTDCGLIGHPRGARRCRVRRNAARQRNRVARRSPESRQRRQFQDYEDELIAMFNEVGEEKTDDENFDLLQDPGSNDEDYGDQLESYSQLPERKYQGLPGNTRHSKNESLECRICMSEYKRGDWLKTLPCFHSFHSKCIDKWLNIKSQCPICRFRVNIAHVYL